MAAKLFQGKIFVMLLWKIICNSYWVNVSAVGEKARLDTRSCEAEHEWQNETWVSAVGGSSLVPSLNIYFFYAMAVQSSKQVKDKITKNLYTLLNRFFAFITYFDVIVLE